MSSISTSYSSSAVTTNSNKGFSGLMSGLDTDDLVKGMTISIRNKIAKQMQSKQLLTWKTDAYRAITSKLTDFSNRFLTYSSSTNALASKFYTSKLITPKGENSGAVSVTGASPFADSLSVLSISSLASRASFAGAEFSTKPDIAVEALNAELGDTLSLNSGNKIAVKINDTVLEFDATKSIKQITDEINNNKDLGVNIQYSATTNRFVVTATKTGASGRVDIEDVDGSNFASLMFGVKGTDYEVNEGTDAVMKISYDGCKTTSSITSSTNIFEIDGLTVTVLSEFSAPTGSKGITFEQKSNTDEIYKNIKSIIDEYNSMIEALHKELNTKYNRNYPPLTNEQKTEMSESEIKKWEEEAKTGILYNDGTLRSLASELRFVLPISAKDIGISTSVSWMDNGKITIDEEKLRKAIEDNPDAVTNIFIAPKDSSSSSGGGIITRMKEITDKYASTIGEKGLLVKLAGVEGSITASESSLYKKIQDIEKSITAMQRTQKMQEDRFYKQFTTLETYMSKISAQSSWLSQQLGGS